MNRLRWILLVILVCYVTGLGIFETLAGTEALASDPTGTPTPGHCLYLPLVMKSYSVQYRHGDWIVTGLENVENATIVLDGNLIIELGGWLTFTNVTLLVEQKPQGMYQIFAKPESSLVISNSTIISLQRDYRFAFIVQGAHFVLKQSKLEGLGRPSGYNPGGGLLISDTNGTVLEGNIINHHESYGVTMSNSTYATISNNTITCTGPDETSGAINLDNSHNNIITYNRLYRQWDAIHLQASWNNYIAYNHLTLTDHTIGISVWHGSGNNIVAYNHISAHEGYDTV